VDDSLGHSIRVAVGRGTAVLEVATAVLAHLPRNADAGAAVGHAGREVVDAGGLVVAGEAPLVVLPAARVVDADVLGVAQRQLLDGSHNVSVIERRTAEASDHSRITFADFQPYYPIYPH